MTMPRTGSAAAVAALAFVLGLTPASARELDCPRGDPTKVAGIPHEGGQEKYNAGWSFYFDNDVFAPKNQDDDYTYGLALTLAGRRAREWPVSLDGLLARVDALGAVDCHPFILHSLQTGVVAFTPSEITDPSLIPGDRPYASIVYLANGRNYIRDRSHPVYQTGFSIGVLGLRVAGALQNALHRTMGIDEAEGWPHQIADGGEPTFRYTIARQDLLASNFQTGATEYEFKSSFAGSVGYLTDASAAVSLRWGRINTPWWSFPPERVEYIAEPAPVIGGPDIRPGSRELYFWSGVKIRARLYNAFLQGQFRDSELDYDYRDLHPFIGEAWAGVTAQFTEEYRLSWVVRYQTAELRVEPGERDVLWGTLFLSRDL